MFDNLTKNWRTTLCAAGIVACYVGSLWMPGLSLYCGYLKDLCITAGLLAAADASTLQQLAQPVKDWLSRMQAR